MGMTVPYRILYTEALNFLSNKAGADYVAKQLIVDIPIDPAEAKSLNDIYFRLINAMISTKRMKQAIGPVERLGPILLKYDPVKIASKYGKDWERLAGEIRGYLESAEDSNREDMDTHWPYWEVFCKNTVAGALFLHQLKDVRTFKAFVQSFQSNEMTTSVLPMLLQKEICGLTFASACNFLTQVGFDHYIAPDSKVKALLYDVEIIESKGNYDLLKALLSIGVANGEKPKLINKVFRIIASGELIGMNAKANNLRYQFIDHVMPILVRAYQN
jgi:hypothetical protein